MFMNHLNNSFDAKVNLKHKQLGPTRESTLQDRVIEGFKGKELGSINVKQFLYYTVHLRQEYVIFVYLYNTIS